jgi:YD repeat-containing protein
VRYAYDAKGNLTHLTYPDGRSVRYWYDALDRLAAREARRPARLTCVNGAS